MYIVTLVFLVLQKDVEKWCLLALGAINWSRSKKECIRLVDFEPHEIFLGDTASLRALGWYIVYRDTIWRLRWSRSYSVTYCSLPNMESQILVRHSAILLTCCSLRVMKVDPFFLLLQRLGSHDWDRNLRFCLRVWKRHVEHRINGLEVEVADVKIWCHACQSALNDGGEKTPVRHYRTLCSVRRLLAVIVESRVTDRYMLVRVLYCWNKFASMMCLFLNGTSTNRRASVEIFDTTSVFMIESFWQEVISIPGWELGHSIARWERRILQA